MFRRLRPPTRQGFIVFLFLTRDSRSPSLDVFCWNYFPQIKGKSRLKIIGDLFAFILSQTTMRLLKFFHFPILSLALSWAILLLLLTDGRQKRVSSRIIIGSWAVSLHRVFVSFNFVKFAQTHRRGIPDGRIQMKLLIILFAIVLHNQASNESMRHFRILINFGVICFHTLILYHCILWKLLS